MQKVVIHSESFRPINGVLDFEDLAEKVNKTLKKFPNANVTWLQSSADDNGTASLSLTAIVTVTNGV